MVIVDLSSLESDFCKRATINTGALKVRSMDINEEYAMFIYYYDDEIRLSISRYDDQQISYELLDCLSNVGVVYPDVHFCYLKESWINEEKQSLCAIVNYKDVATWKKEG